MSYRDALSPWCIVQHLPNMRRQIILRFRQRNNAEDHLRLLKALSPAITYELMFDLSLEQELRFRATPNLTSSPSDD
ncbi:MAG: hypothetical protein KME07_07340 [Pegethrix bostrychoides GSE-TBD4-15B]|jgi:hypothetical protein|uniref:Uncharacterized protein n=1 Tax=Pegethrix bostrychoides GSE-TBD4-15B TaxID=2839662 RepID=A0A951U440_9CYAN|nr:hypothetical protein [Pegethrix bostrychoides GSE-TBD4-15B]